MKIGIDIRLIGKKRTGDEAVFFNLVKALAQISTNHEFKLLTDVTDSATLEKISEQLGIVGKENFKIVSLVTKNRFSWNFLTLPRYLKNNPVDIYLTQYITPWFVSRKVKIVTIVHDISFNFFPQFIKFADLLFLKTLIPISLARADKIIGVSQFTRDEIIKFYKIDVEKVDYIYNAVGDDFLNKQVSMEEKETVREKYELPENFFLYLGTLQPRKNIPFLLEAFAKIKDRLPEMKLVIAGGKNAHNFDKRIDEVVKKHKLEEAVIFSGYVEEDDKKALYGLSQAFVLPSLYEGFGIPLLEAINQGVPVLAGDIPSLKEIAVNGAIYSDVQSVDEFSNKLYDIIKDQELRNKLIHAGYERVSFFSWKKTASRMLAIFEKMYHNGQVN